MTETSSSLVDRLLASILCRDLDFEKAVNVLIRLGMEPHEVKAVLQANELQAVGSQRQLIETLFGMGLDAAAISELTGLPKTTVGPEVSRLKGRTNGASGAANRSRRVPHRKSDSVRMERAPEQMVVSTLQRDEQ